MAYFMKQSGDGMEVLPVNAGDSHLNNEGKDMVVIPDARGRRDINSESAFGYVQLGGF
jgi:hypothetical protein